MLSPLRLPLSLPSRRSSPMLPSHRCCAFHHRCHCCPRISIPPPIAIAITLLLGLPSPSPSRQPSPPLPSLSPSRLPLLSLWPQPLLPLPSRCCCAFDCCCRHRHHNAVETSVAVAAVMTPSIAVMGKARQKQPKTRYCIIGDTQRRIERTRLLEWY